MTEPPLETPPDGSEGEKPIDGDFDPSRAWINDLPEKYHGKESLKKFRSGEGVEMISMPETFLDSYENLEGMLSSKKRLPDTEEEQIAFYEDLGWKSDFEEYSKGIERAKMPDGIEYDTQEEEYLLQLAHESHVPLEVAQNQYNKIVEARINSIKEEETLLEDYLSRREEENKKAYGADVKVIRTRAEAVIEDYMDDNFKRVLNEAMIDGLAAGDHPDTIGFFAKLGKDKLGVGDERGKTQAETSEDIERQINDLMAKPEYMDGNHPKHAQAVTDMERLWMKKTGQL